jgi:hypothetical protein
VSPRGFRQPRLPHGLVAGVALPPTGDQVKALARQHLIRPPELGRCRGAYGVSPPLGGDHLAPLVSRRGGAQQPDGAGGVCRARQIDMRPRETGAFLGHLYAALEPDEVQQSRTARGLRAFAEDVGSYLPERNDPHETPFHERPDVMMGDIIPFAAAASQTILARDEGGHTRYPLGAAGGRAVHERSPDVGAAEGQRGPLPLAIQAGVYGHAQAPQPLP